MTRTSAFFIGIVMWSPVSTFGIRSGCSKAGGTGTSPTGPPMTVSVPRIPGWKVQ